MKIVLTHNKNIKLYTNKFNYDLLVQFAAKEFQLAINTIKLTFKDE